MEAMNAQLVDAGGSAVGRRLIGMALGSGRKAHGVFSAASPTDEPRHGRKGASYELVFDRSNAGVMRGMAGSPSSPIVAFSDTNISVDGFRVSSSRKYQWGKEGTYLILQFSNRRVNTPADAARFTTEGLAH